jgi:NhaP-type Na+/H+ or K+/H+ antiporter
MIAVATSMIGSDLALPTLAYLGWFGPRGLASIIFVGVLVDAVGLEGSHLIVSAVIVTVTFSVLLHGVTAPWGANKYADWADGQSEPAGQDESAG